MRVNIFKKIIFVVSFYQFICSPTMAEVLAKSDSKNGLYSRYQIYNCGPLMFNGLAPVGAPSYNLLYDGDRVIIQKLAAYPRSSSEFLRTRYEGSFDSGFESREYLDLYGTTDEARTMQVMIFRDMDTDEVLDLELMSTDNSDFRAECKQL